MNREWRSGKEKRGDQEEREGEREEKGGEEEEEEDREREGGPTPGSTGGLCVCVSPAGDAQ